MTSIQELFAGNIVEFLSQDTVVFNGIRNLLDQQFNRLSDLEKKIMLAVNREPVSPSELRDDFVPLVSKANLIEALQSLKWRSLIEKNSTFTQQPVVMEYITSKLLSMFKKKLLVNKLNYCSAML